MTFVALLDKLCLVIEAQHHRTGRGHAFMKVEMKDIMSGSKYYERFRSDQDVEVIQLQTRPYQFLYKSETGYNFMHSETYEQIEIPPDNAGPKAVYLEDGAQVLINFHEDKPISIQLPDQATCIVKQAEAYIKGQSAVSGYKPAVLENGRRITVPPFISAGDRVVVKIETEAYVGRASNTQDE
eukprot:TRINITY_DN494_c0_g2_i2.p1 TRINITY_DN494_c0_g2~~TRINITY_DN494_c0_g2_i2.p1  ORF type:complete len:183 (-),score=42.07 TRINITY_DN494_c0_g2_i2:408-956(-)